VNDESDGHESSRDGVRNHRDENDDRHKLMVKDVLDCCSSICRTDCTYVPIGANLPMACLNAI
jgi:hypothetical protein